MFRFFSRDDCLTLLGVVLFFGIGVWLVFEGRQAGWLVAGVCGVASVYWARRMYLDARQIQRTQQWRAPREEEIVPNILYVQQSRSDKNEGV